MELNHAEVNGSTENRSQTDVVEELCSRLKLSEDITKKAKALVYTPSQHQDLQLISACMVYIAVIDTRLPYGLEDPQCIAGRLCAPAVTVSDILCAANISVKTFLCQVGDFRQSGDLSPAVLQHFNTVERNFLITCPLYHKYVRLLDEIFIKDGCSVENSSSDEGSELSWEGRKTLGWLLFIYVKGIRNDGLELLSSFHLLICCLHYLIQQTPTFLLHTPYDAVRLSGEVTLLETLCSQCLTDINQVKQVDEGMFALAVGHLPKKNSVLVVDDIKSRYEERLRGHGGINELLFLEESPHLHLQTTREQNNNARSLMESPVPPAVQTPVRKAVAAVNQLNEVLNQTSDQPSPALRAICQRCAVDPLPGIAEQIQSLSDKCVQCLTSEPQICGLDTASQRMNMTRRLFYKALHAMLSPDQEDERLTSADLTALLDKADFHSALFATAAEVVMATYSTPSVTSHRLPADGSTSAVFPWILSALGIHAYHMLRVLEPFLKSLSGVHHDIITHLQGVECRILLSHAWKAGSPLLTSLSQSSLVPPDPSPQNICVSPMRTRNGQCGDDMENLSKQSPWKVSNSMSYFFHKVSKVAYQRLHSLCQLLNLPKDLHREAWICVEKCLTHQTHLLINRHLDQIIMCSIYGVCKVCDHDLKFKAIVNCYIDLPYTSSQTYKHVRIKEGKQDSIIVFYNTVFMVCVKNDLLQCASNRSKTVNSSPLPKRLEASPVFPLPGAKNFYVSPLKQSPFKTPLSPGQMTPRTRHLYSFGESLNHGDRLKNFNQLIRAGVESPRDSKRPRVNSPSVHSPRTFSDFVQLRSKQPSASTRKSLNFADHPPKTE